MNPSRFRASRSSCGIVLAAAVFALSQSVSCGLSEERWTEQAPQVSCKLLRRCDPITFHRDFEDLDACVDATTLGDREGCQYEPDAARQCREALGWSCRKVGQRYDEVVQRCNTIWTCDTGTPEAPTELEGLF